MNKKASAQPRIYRIRIKETLDRPIASMVGEISLEPQKNGETVLVGPFMDQSALRGLLNQLWDLNFTILLVECTANEETQYQKTSPREWK